MPKRLERPVVYESKQPFTMFANKEYLPEDEVGVPLRICFCKLGYKNNKPIQGRFRAVYQYQVDTIENDKRFKSGFIIRKKTAEEIAEEKRQQEIRHRIKQLKDVPVDFESMKKDELVDFAASIGIEIKPTVPPMKKETIIEKIKKVLK